MVVDRCEGCPLKKRRVCRKDRGCTEEPLIAFVGSSPRSYEIKAGTAFTGEGPKVLRQVLTHLDVPIDRCFFTHAIRCQTEKGKKAKVAAIRACQPELHERLRQIRPRLIVAMGDDAVRSFISTTRAASTVRGHIGTFSVDAKTRIPVLPTIEAHRIVRVNPRFVADDEKHDASGSPDAFPDLVTDINRAVRHVLHGEPLVERIPYADYYLADTPEKVDRVIERLDRLEPGTVIAADVETDSLDYRTGRILTLGLCWQRGTGIGIQWGVMHAGQQSRLFSRLARFPMVFHNGVYDVPWMRKAGMQVEWAGDTMLMHYVVDERKGTHKLERLAIDRYSWPPYETALKAKYKVGNAADDESEASYANVDMPDLLRYNVADCDATFRLWEDLGKEAEDDAVRHVHDDILMPAAEHFMRLERDGMLVDLEYLEEKGAEWKAEIDALEEELKAHPGAEDINFGSWQQIAKFLYDELKLEQMPGKPGEYIDPDIVLSLTDQVEDEEAQEYFRTAASTEFMKLKPRSTSTYMLWWLAQQHPWPRAMVRRRIVGTRYGNYYEGVKNRLVEGRIRPQFHLHGSRTGRLSSHNPNIHGIARNNEIKNIWIADPGHVLIAADYSQAEVRMMAHFAEDDTLIEALAAADIHTAISLRLFGLTQEQLDGMDKEKVKFMRRAAKTIIFGLIYGRSAKSLAPQLGVSIEETEQYIQDLFRMMPKVPQFIRQQQARVLAEQEAISLFGRKRRFPLVLKANRSEVKRKGVNMPIQSTVSDMTLMANLEIIRSLDEVGARPKVWPHIHDGFLFQVPEEHEDLAVEVTKEKMLRPPFETEVHFAAEIEVGRRWGEMKQVFEG